MHCRLYVSSNVKSSQFGAMLYIFEDNEAVIKMIVKGRSPTMRHVSRTHSILCVPQKNVDTKHQLADILTKGNFTRDEWNNLLHLCNISHFSSVCCSQNFSSASCPKTMAKSMQQGTGEERTVAKSKLRSNLVSKTEASSSTVLSPNASNRPGILIAPSQKGLILQESTG